MARSIKLTESQSKHSNQDDLDADYYSNGSRGSRMTLQDKKLKRGGLKLSKKAQEILSQIYDEEMNTANKPPKRFYSKQSIMEEIPFTS